MSLQVVPPDPRITPHARVPVPLTAFVGRRRELQELTVLLQSHRLVTLTGAAGSGKTRLAAEAVRTLSADTTAAWIELAALPTGDLVAGQVAALLGIRHQAGTDVVDTLVATLAPMRVLLVLDNCEHVIDACAQLAARLLQECPELRIVATSRQPLGIAGERSRAVPPLALPSASPPDFAVAAEAEAVQLFAQRAADVVAGFTLTSANIDAVVRICRRLDGLPLAIELAAARANVLPPDQLVRRLDDVFGILTTGSRTLLPRHRTLRALLDWSYELLDSAERLLLRRLSVFAGGFTLSAAETVPPARDLASCDVLDLLAALVDRSLVVMTERAGEARYSLLETVRQYARTRLSAEESEAELAQLFESHARYFMARAAAADEALHGAQQLAALAELDAEHDNMRAALAWSIGRADVMLALNLCRVLGTFWALRGHHTEGRRWIEDALRLDAPSCGLAAHALTTSGVFARMHGEHDVARARHAHAATLAREADDPRALADALTNLGSELALHRDLEGARTALTEAVELRRQLGVPWALSQALSARAGVALTAGDAALARTLRLEAADVSRRANDRAGEARALVGLGEVARLSGDWEQARAYNQRAIELFRQLGDIWQMSAALQNLGWIAAACGSFEQSLDAFAEFFQIFIAAGNHRIGAGLCLAGVSPALHAQGSSELAARALGTAQRAFAVVGIKPAAADQRQWDVMRDTLRAALGEAAFERAWTTDLPGDLLDAADDLLARARAAYAMNASVAPTIAEPDAAYDACEDCDAPARDEPAGASSPDLCVLALGPLRVLRCNEPITPEMWGSARPRELLLYLLTSPEGRTREQVGATFWPEATSAQLSNSFHVTLYRLRKALGRSDWIVLDRDRYRVAPHLDVDFDALRFEGDVTAVLRTLRRAAHEGRTDVTDDDVARLSRALELYRGDFLEDVGAGAWAQELRDRLQRLYADGLVALGTLQRARGHYDDAADAFRRAIARDDLNEPAYRGLMQVLVQSGHRADALRLFQRLRTVLRAELDVDPEPATMAVLEGLDATG